MANKVCENCFFYSDDCDELRSNGNGYCRKHDYDVRYDELCNDFEDDEE